MTAAELRALLDYTNPQGAISETTCKALLRLALAARDLRQCGIEHDDPRVGYVLAQLDRQDLREFDAALAAVFTGDDDE